MLKYGTILKQFAVPRRANYELRIVLNDCAESFAEVAYRQIVRDKFNRKYRKTCLIYVILVIKKRKLMSLSNSELNQITKNNQTSWKIKLLYDGECPLCVREVNFLKRRDAGRGLVAFVDIADINYNPETNAGIDFETAMGRIHAILPDGSILKNVEVFRRIYETLGMGWIYAITKLPIIGFIADKIYAIWADFRLALTGREDLSTIIAKRQEQCAIDGENQSRCRM